MKRVLLMSLVAIFLSSCGFTEMMEKTNKMTKIIQSNCDCDDVRLLSYEDNTIGTITAYFEIVGTDIEKHSEIASKINNSLKKNISDFCNIDGLTLDFINKGEHNKITIENCEIKE
jgi:hypothetical protein